jgi:Kelch motif
LTLLGRSKRIDADESGMSTAGLSSRFGGVVLFAAALLASCAVATSASASAGTWVSGGDMFAKRYAHAAVRLPSGDVLVAGGVGGDANTTPTLASAEVFVPATRTWRPTRSMSVPRRFFSATLLQSGKVLVAGGYDGAVSHTKTAELFDPQTGSWVRTGDMIAPRAEHTATLLSDGRVLVAGGNDAVPGEPAFRGAELYDPASGAWSLAASLPSATFGGVGTTLPDASVLLNGWELSPAARYIPSSNRWARTGPMAFSEPHGRLRPAAAALDDGSVLLTGGYDGTVVERSSELYRPATDTWAPTGAMNVERWHFTATKLRDGSVLVAGGAGSGAPAAVTRTAELYDPAAGRWSLTASMAEPREGATASLLADGTVLVAGGSNNTGTYFSSAELYVPATTTDRTPPVTTASASPAANSTGWNRSSVTVRLHATDEAGGSGVDHITYAATGAQRIPTTDQPGADSTISVSSEGVTTLTFFATDRAGNRERARTLTIRIDSTPPMVTCGARPAELWPPNHKLRDIAVTVTVRDSVSGPAGFALEQVAGYDGTRSMTGAALDRNAVGWSLGTADVAGQLRAERAGGSVGRRYEVRYRGSDRAGNVATCVAVVHVPHDRGH